MFKNAKVGDKVWDVRRGWGEITDIEWTSRYPIGVKFLNSSYGIFSSEGKVTVSDSNPTLYWDDLRIVPPKKPLSYLAVDTKVLVWDDGDDYKIRAYFHSFNEDGNIITYSNGRSNFTGEDKVKSVWDNWELYEE